MRKTDPRIAYFSMEIALAPTMPTYSGGLGILAGDTIRSAADMEVPMVAVTLLHRQGYFKQQLDAKGNQTEQPDSWRTQDFLTEVPVRVGVNVEGRRLELRAWRYDVKGHTGFTVPVYLLDADLADNTTWDRSLTDSLYGGDLYYRICQELILGIGGVRLLKALDYRSVVKYHMNEGHSALLVLELLDEQMHLRGLDRPDEAALAAVQSKCVFTTHTPVEAGHDRFPMELALRVLDHKYLTDTPGLCGHEGTLNMTYLAMNMSHYINGVAKKHGEVSQDMFAAYKIDSITNGVHAGTWAGENFAALFDRYIPDWQSDNFALRYALSIPREEVWEAHRTEKRKLFAYIAETTGVTLSENLLTIGFARRATAYKRHDLLFHDINRLKALAIETPGFQLVYAGKAHPRDEGGKEMIRRVMQAREELAGVAEIVYLPNYNMDVAKYLVSGVDIWLNTPQAPLEASGTSGMKAALNGIPSFSILDGWWIEGCIDGVTGWAIGESAHLVGAAAGAELNDRIRDAEALYKKLETAILPTYYQNRDHFIDMMRLTIALNGSFFNTQRMVQQYIQKAYFSS